MATVLTLYSSNLSNALWKCNYQKSFKFRERTFGKYLFHEQNNTSFLIQDIKSLNSYTRYATTKGSTTSSQSDEEIPSWAKPGSDEPPPWASEEGGKSVSEQTFEIPFYVYLLASAITAIASIGSVFEYVNQKPVFGILGSDSIFYAPLLGFFALTGIPTSAFLWFKSVQVANKAAEEQDRRDGFR